MINVEQTSDGVRIGREFVPVADWVEFVDRVKQIRFRRQLFLSWAEKACVAVKTWPEAEAAIDICRKVYGERGQMCLYIMDDCMYLSRDNGYACDFDKSELRRDNVLLLKDWKHD